jgi:uncharacterized membrane protein
MIEKRRKKFDFTNEKILSQFMYVNFIAVIPIVLLYFHISSRNEIIEDFNKNRVLTCDLRTIVIEVKKEDGWKLEDYSFIKGESKFPISKCELK